MRSDFKNLFFFIFSEKESLEKIFADPCLKHGKNGFDLLPGPDFGPGLNLYCVVYRAKFTDFCSAIFSNDEKRKFLSKFR